MSSSPIEIEDEINTNEVDVQSQTTDYKEEERDMVDLPGIEDGKISKGGHKRKSKVWEYFVEVEVEEFGKKVQKLECMFCKRRYKYVDGGPTSTLQRHLNQCAAMKRAKGQTQGMITFESEESVTFPGGTSGGYDLMKNREIMAKMIMAHELPFAFVEYTWFITLMKYNNSLFQKVSRFTIKNECIKVYESEKEKMKKAFKNISRNSLTSDCWTSNQTVGYMSLTAHYVDADWKLQK